MNNNKIKKIDEKTRNKKCHLFLKCYLHIQYNMKQNEQFIPYLKFVASLFFLFLADVCKI